MTWERDYEKLTALERGLLTRAHDFVTHDGVPRLRQQVLCVAAMAAFDRIPLALRGLPVTPACRFLYREGLVQYCRLLDSAGYKDVRDLAFADVADLSSAGVAWTPHVRRITGAAREWSAAPRSPLHVATSLASSAAWSLAALAGFALVATAIGVALLALLGSSPGSKERLGTATGVVAATAWARYRIARRVWPHLGTKDRRPDVLTPLRVASVPRAVVDITPASIAPGASGRSVEDLAPTQKAEGSQRDSSGGSNSPTGLDAAGPGRVGARSRQVGRAGCLPGMHPARLGGYLSSILRGKAPHKVKIQLSPIGSARSKTSSGRLSRYDSAVSPALEAR
ncbi:unnamed protein product [Pedinophyceae sp. YPF-701]|nr:unnamed protein product [Pedinophyceae sp. YPF-701]